MVAEIEFFFYYPDLTKKGFLFVDLDKNEVCRRKVDTQDE